jgi:predicted RND superfamily exporter protein
LGLFLAAGIILAFVSNYFVIVKRLQSFHNLFLDLESPKEFLRNHEKWINAQRIRQLIGIILATLGLAAFIIILMLLS